MNHDNDCNWGPKIGGSRDSYTQIREVSPSTGDRIRIHIPGLFPIETTVNVGFGGACTVNILGKTYFVGDRTNAAHPDHTWQVQFEVTVPTKAEAILALPSGTMFFTTKEESLTRSVFVRTAEGVHNITDGRTADPGSWLLTNRDPAPEGYPYIIGRLESAS